MSASDQLPVGPQVRFGSRLCENSDAKLARRISISISSLWKPIALVGATGNRAIEKAILSVLGSDAFLHSLGQSLTKPLLRIKSA